MVRGISHNVRETLREELGDLGESIYEKQCWDMGVPPDSLSYEDLEELAEKVYEAVRYFIGMKKADKVKNSIRKYSILNRLNKLRDEERGMVRLIKECKLHIELGDTDIAIGNMEEAVKDYKRSLEIAEELDRDDLRAESLIGLVHAHLEMGEIDEASRYQAIGHEICKKLGDTTKRACCRRVLGVINWRKGRYDDALKCFNDALELYTDEDDHSGMAIVYDHLGDLYGEMENYDKSKEYYEISGDLFSDAKDEYQQIVSLMNRGVIYSIQKDWENAAELYRKSKEMAEEHRFPNMLAWSLFNLGESYIYLGEHDKAEEAFKRSSKLLKDQQDPFGEAGVKVKYGQLCVERGDYDEAVESLSQGIKILRELGIPRYLADALHELGKAKGKLGEKEEAIDLIEESIELYDRLELEERKERVRADLEELTK